MVQVPHELELTSPCTMVPFNYIRDQQLFKNYIYQDWRKPPQPVRPNSTPHTIQLNVWAADNFIIADILFLSVILCVISLTSLKITLPLCLLLSFSQNRILCKHNAWTNNNLTPLHILFPSIIA